jgi:hypothetical protein
MEGMMKRMRNIVVSGMVLAVVLLITSKGAFAQWTTNGTNIYNTNTGNVGIGTSTPAQALHILGDDYHSAFRVQGTGTGYGPKVQIWSFAPNGKNFTLHSGQSFDFGGAITGKFAISDDSVGAPRLVIDGNGNVGVGITSPQGKLHVSGDIIVDGNLAAKYQDLAEWVPAGDAIESGSVVITDPVLAGHVLPSSEAYDTRVAGVVSSSPGIVLGEASIGNVKVATVGRVKVKVDATQNPIRIGDLLVTSGNAGVAMKSEPIETRRSQDAPARNAPG